MGHPEHDYASVKGYLSHLDNYILHAWGQALLEEERAWSEQSCHLNCFGGGIQKLNVILL